MDWRAFKEKAVIFIQRPVFSVSLLVVVLLGFLMRTGNFTQLLIFTAICAIVPVGLALRRTDKMGAQSQLRLKGNRETAAQSFSSQLHYPNSGSPMDSANAGTVVSIFEDILSSSRCSAANSIQRFAALLFAKGRAVQEIDGERLIAESGSGHDSTESTQGIHQGSLHNLSQAESKVPAFRLWSFLQFENSSIFGSKNNKDDAFLGSLRSNSSLEEEDGDVPELEECSSSSGEDEIICITVVESTAAVGSTESKIKENEGLENILEPSVKAANRSGWLEEDENSVDKHQILPLESSMQVECIHNLDRFRPKEDKLELTDAELQDVAGDFYTLEGDVLWHESDIRKLQASKQLKDLNQLPPASKQGEVCEQEYDYSPDDYTIFPYKMQSGVQTVVSLPLDRRVHQANLIKAPENKVDGKFEDRSSASQEIDEDALIDQGLRAMAFGRGKKGEESCRSFATASFREFEECWPELCSHCNTSHYSKDDLRCNLYSYSSRISLKDSSLINFKEPGGLSGCCDQPKPCIAHSRSRSKVLQSDPLLSRDSLMMREQEMDVLWQEYNEDPNRRCTSTNCSLEINQATTQQRVHWRSQSGLLDEYASANAQIENQSSAASNCKACWQAKARGFPRRKYFPGICRVFKELGLKQCIQSSQVKK